MSLLPQMSRHKVHGRTSNGNLENGPQSAEPRLAQGDVTAVNAGDVAGDGQSKSGRFGILIARVIEPVKRPKHLIALIFGNAWPVVLDLDHKRAILPSSADRDVVGEAHGIVDQIGDGALEGMEAKLRARHPDFDPTFRDQLQALLAWRRDVRRFRRDALPQGAIERLIEIACLSPSVGLSEPWRFVIVEDQTRRAAIRTCFEACNQDALRRQEPDRASLYARLKLSGLDDAPCQIAVFADHATAQGHGLGRLTMLITHPDASFGSARANSWVRKIGARSRKGDYFGPFASAGAVGRTINTLQRAFLLRSW